MLLAAITLNMKVMEIKDKNLDKIKPYLSDIINDYETGGEWKI